MNLTIEKVKNGFIVREHVFMNCPTPLGYGDNQPPVYVYATIEEALILRGFTVTNSEHVTVSTIEEINITFSKIVIFSEQVNVSTTLV